MENERLKSNDEKQMKESLNRHQVVKDQKSAVEKPSKKNVLIVDSKEFPNLVALVNCKLTGQALLE